MNSQDVGDAFALGGGPPALPATIASGPQIQLPAIPPQMPYVGAAPRPRREDEDYQLRADSPRSPRESWSRVQLGLKFVIIAVYVMLGGILIGIVGQLFLMGASFNAAAAFNPAGLAGASSGMMALLVVQRLIGLVVTGLQITGYSLALAVPPKRGVAVRGLALATFILGAVGGVLILIVAIMEVSLSGSGRIEAYGAAGVMAMLSGLTSLAGFVVFLFYLRSLCFAMRKAGTASSVTSFMIAALVFIVFCFLVGIIMAVVMGATVMLGASSPASAIRQGQGFVIVALALMCLAGLVALGLFVWYVILLHQVYNVMNSHIRRLE